MSAVDDIVAERKRQIEQEGFTAEHDDKHARGELAKAAASYAFHAGVHFHVEIPGVTTRPIGRPGIWPWSREWWKPTTTPRQDLVKAGALILAEIERIDRLPEDRR